VDKDHVFRPLYTIQTIRAVDSQVMVSYFPVSTITQQF